VAHDLITNAHLGHAATAARGVGSPRIGTVVAFNGAQHAARVMIQPEGAETGWLPVLAAAVGGGWGIQAGLEIGAQVLVAPRDGDLNSGVVLGAIWSDADRAPGAPSEELWMIHKAGALVKLTNDGQVLVQDAHGTKLHFTNDGTVVVEGNLAVTGSIVGGHGTGGSVNLQTHTHAQPNDSHGDTEHETNSPTPGT
jgi:uncharacterized protein involved in type VI secretion and phage assembly